MSDDEDWGDVGEKVQKLDLGGDGEDEDVVGELSAKFQADNSNVGVAVELARAHAENDDSDAAQDVLKVALTANPNNGDLLYTLGKVCADEGNAEAESHFLEAIKQDGDHVDARYALASLALSNGNDDGALEHLKALLAVDANHNPALYFCGQVLAGKRSPESASEAVEYLKRAVSVKPSDTRSTVLLVECHDFLGQTAERDAAIATLSDTSGRYCVSQIDVNDKVVRGYQHVNTGDVRYSFAVFNKNEVHDSKVLADVVVEKRGDVWVTHSTKPEAVEFSSNNEAPSLDDVKAQAAALA